MHEPCIGTAAVLLPLLSAMLLCQWVCSQGLCLCLFPVEGQANAMGVPMHHNKFGSDCVSSTSQPCTLLLCHHTSSLCECRYGIAADLVQELLPDLRAAAASAPESLTWPPPASPSDNGVAERGRAALSSLVAVAVWLRFSSLRLLTWNHNYNVKPREISAALDRLGASLVEVRVCTCMGSKTCSVRG